MGLFPAGIMHKDHSDVEKMISFEDEQLPHPPPHVATIYERLSVFFLEHFIVTLIIIFTIAVWYFRKSLYLKLVESGFPSVFLSVVGITIIFFAIFFRMTIEEKILSFLFSVPCLWPAGMEYMKTKHKIE